VQGVSISLLFLLNPVLKTTLTFNSSIAAFVVLRKKYMATLTAMGASAVLFSGTSAQALTPNLVKNPSFEANNNGTQFVGSGFFPLVTVSNPSQTPATLTDWTVAPSTLSLNQSIALLGSNNITGGNSWLPLANPPSPITNSGTYFFEADGGYQDGFEAAISQTISGLTVGASYELSFDWAAGQCVTYGIYCGGEFNSGWAIAFGSDMDSVNSGNLAAQTFNGWLPYNKVFTATASSQTLSFLSRGGPSSSNPKSMIDNVSLRKVEVPGPLGILGVATAFGYSRRLRRRISRG
jgi:hypothetical protein